MQGGGLIAVMDRSAIHPAFRDEDPASLRRRNTLLGPPLRVLSLDGGGVRGYSMLIQLQELMHRIFVEIEGQAPKRDEIPKPCDHFDLIVGTGTGGLIAIMLGRLRLDLETCKDVYTKMTQRVFETDKTIAGIPYRSTLFKASKLEEAIKECVQEHTVYEDEGGIRRPHSSHSSTRPTRHSRRLSRTGTNILRQAHGQSGPRSSRRGDADALLYDTRQNITKTAVTAYYKGSTAEAAPALLRSYDSRKEPAPEFECKIWEAGRATCATGLAFKPITIGQSVFIDEGPGRYNPAPLALDEAMINEWPGRPIGVFLSIGTGKRPHDNKQSHAQWWESYVSENMGNFAEARRRLVAKIEGCEETHRMMLNEMLPSRGVALENYIRLNVEVGVGEFSINEWARLAEISTSTRRYLAKPEIQEVQHLAASKLATLYRMNGSRTSTMAELASPSGSQFSGRTSLDSAPFNMVELPAADVDPSMMSHQPLKSAMKQSQRPMAYRMPSANDKFTVITSDEFPSVLTPPVPPPRPRTPALHTTNLAPVDANRESQIEITPRTSSEVDGHYRDSTVQISPRESSPAQPPPLPPREPSTYVQPVQPAGPPPLPPKTPLLGPGDAPSFTFAEVGRTTSNNSIHSRNASGNSNYNGQYPSPPAYPSYQQPPPPAAITITSATPIPKTAAYAPYQNHPPPLPILQNNGGPNSYETALHSAATAPQPPARALGPLAAAQANARDRLFVDDDEPPPVVQRGQKPNYSR